MGIEVVAVTAGEAADPERSIPRAMRTMVLRLIVFYVLAIVVTALYFVSELRAFKNSPNMAVSPAEWYARGQRWQHLSWTRGAVMGLSYIALLLALAWPEDNDV